MVTTDRVIVDFIAEIIPPVEVPDAKAFERNPDGYLCTFRHGGSARLRPGSASPALLRIMEGRRQRKVPVYVETADDESITRVLIPLIRKTSAVRDGKGGSVEIDMFPSPVVYTLSRKAPDFQALLGALLRGAKDDQWLLVTAGGNQEILHVASMTPEDLQGLRLPKPPSPIDVLRSWSATLLLKARRGWRQSLFFSIVSKWFPPKFPSVSDVWDMFNLVAGKTCDTTVKPPDCIPFLYPDNGCMSRAHEMCRMMSAAGVVPYKVWVNQSAGHHLDVKTKNHPHCAVRWSFHVAPAIDVFLSSYVWETFIIDPAICDGPVTQAEWVAKMTDPSPTTVPRSWLEFWSGQFDASFDLTNGELSDMRDELTKRVLRCGPPPYGNC